MLEQQICTLRDRRTQHKKTIIPTSYRQRVRQCAPTSHFIDLLIYPPDKKRAPTFSTSTWRLAHVVGTIPTDDSRSGRTRSEHKHAYHGPHVHTGSLVQYIGFVLCLSSKMNIKYISVLSTHKHTHTQTYSITGRIYSGGGFRLTLGFRSL